MKRRIQPFPMLFVLLAMFTATVQADELVVDFQDHSPVIVGESWVEQGLELVVVPTGGSQASAIVSRYGLSITQAVLSVDMASLSDVRRAVVEVVTTTGPATTTVVLLDEDGPIDMVENVDILHTEYLTVVAGGATARYLQVGGTNLRLITITIVHGAVGNEAKSWSGIKTLYR